jgi:CubicO group peptidase (beta-lactamase class C family)
MPSEQSIARAPPKPRTQRTAPFWLLLLALVQGCAVPQLVDPAGATAHLERVVAQAATRGFAGQVLVAHGDRVLLLKAVGQRVPGGHAPVTTADPMALVSITKAFTASAVLALVADGRVTLDDPIGVHLPGLPPSWAVIPIENVLTHTAGLPAEIVNRAWTGHPWFEPVGRDAFLAGLANFPPDHPPGAGFNYSNVGYSVLGALIETVTGEDWESYLRHRLLVPAGIHDIGLLQPGWAPERRVHGRVRGEDRGSYFDQPRLPDGLGWRLRAAGDMHASAEGMLDWWRAIRGGGWLPHDELERWITPRVRERDGHHYGYGLQARNSRLGPVLGHTGGDDVFTADWSWYVEADLVIYVASADPAHPADRVREALLHGLRRGVARSR